MTLAARGTYPASAGPSILDARGRLTAYGFGCGYVHRRYLVPLPAGLGSYLSLEMYMEHGVYHIKVLRLDEQGRFLDRLQWQVMETNKEAWKEFHRLRRLYVKHPVYTPAGSAYTKIRPLYRSAAT